MCGCEWKLCDVGFDVSTTCSCIGVGIPKNWIFPATLYYVVELRYDLKNNFCDVIV